MASDSHGDLLEWLQTDGPTIRDLRDEAPKQASYDGNVWWGFYITSSTSADWCGFHIESWNGRVYTRWRGAWWILVGPNPRSALYDPERHQWIREEP